MATARAKPGLPVNYSEQLAKEAAAIASRIAAPSGDRIRTNGNINFIAPDGTEGKEIEGVVVDFISANMYYDGPYVRDNPAAPACYALGPEPAMLVPSPNSPKRQSDTCAGCPMNQFRSAATGEGKACKNTRLLAIVPAEALSGKDADKAPLWILAVPPASLFAFDGFVSACQKIKTVPVGVVVRITLDPKNTFSSPRFSVVRPLKDAELAAVMPRREEATKRLLTEPDVSGYEVAGTKAAAAKPRAPKR